MCYLSGCEKTRFGQGFKCNNKTCNYCKNAPPLNATDKDTFSLHFREAFLTLQSDFRGNYIDD